MSPDFYTVNMAFAALSLGLVLALALGLGRRLWADGSLNAWLKALLMLGLIGPVTMLIPGLAGSGWARVVAYVAYALALGLQANAIARLGGLRLPVWVIGLPALVMAISLLAAMGDPVATRLLLQQMSGVLLLGLVALALFLPERTHWRVRLALALPNAVLGVWQLGVAWQQALSVFSLNAYVPLAAVDLWQGVLSYVVLFAMTLAVVVADLTRADADARQAVLRDGLTGLLERQRWFEAAARIRQHAAQRRNAVTLAVYAIDDLPGIVRREGRIAADRALAVLGHTLRAEALHVRWRAAGRINGELLAVIERSHQSAAHSAVALEGLRARAQSAAEQELGFDLRISLGVVECDPDHALADLLADADRARREADGLLWADTEASPTRFRLVGA